jgi:hypothetical protein
LAEQVAGREVNDGIAVPQGLAMHHRRVAGDKDPVDVEESIR